ncbi:AurF N-oxygenase family protein [Nocardioides sp. Kera G14]|uniref:AurF N-oxygenase family protein n=1 Tax=Nocardioides sp. Kera G14 TaxID=2884264 RepID=UPI001D12EC0C|nr:diiron oxygenase [Nocardioides sp. Kera G14]UDY22191.1 diiron oxygenase [Nocardioides sp. Kera G14]
MTAVQSEKKTGHKIQGRQEYLETLRTLSQASVDQHFDAFKDIDWEALSLEPHDERWILTDADEIGHHPWYKTLPKQRQIEIGMYRWAQVAKVGLQFEQLLIGGVVNHLMWAKNGNPEFRYATHEITEECHHTQMFQEFVNRVNPDVSGAPTLFKMLVPLLASAGAWFPEAFFVGILAGEEPIDHLQKGAMRAGGSHPMANRIMQIHIAEEARHIGFAHQYLEQHIPELDPVRKQVLAALFPIIMGLLCDVIMVPSRRARHDMGIPDEVAKEIWWDSAESSKLRRDMFSDVRMLADELGLRHAVTKPLWRLMGIDGKPARFRGEPASATH